MGFVLQDGSLAEAGQYLIQSKSDNKLYSMSEGAYNSLIRGEGVAYNSLIRGEGVA